MQHHNNKINIKINNMCCPSSPSVPVGSADTWRTGGLLAGAGVTSDEAFECV